MLSILYWISATLPSNIFVLLVVDDLCRHTLTADEERLSSRPYLYTAAAVLMTMADLFHNV